MDHRVEVVVLDSTFYFSFNWIFRAFKDFFFDLFLILYTYESKVHSVSSKTSAFDGLCRLVFIFVS